MKILALIPARGGSKGVPRKNCKLLHHKPLLTYTTDVALQSKYLSEIVVSSDDAEILDLATQLGVQTNLRPDALAQDHSPTIDTVVYILENYLKKGIIFDAVCLLQPTNPFRTVDFLDQAIEKFIQSEADALVSVLEVPHEYNPHWCFEADVNNNLFIATGEKNIISRRQELPKTYHRCGSIYITKAAIVLQQKSLYGNKLAYIVSDITRHINIDTMEDWHKAEEMARNMF